MPKYRKLPVVIEATQWFPGLEVEGVIYPVPPDGGTISFHQLHGDECALVSTLEGDMIVSKGDYIITGVRGERYPCKPDIFAMTYEAVE